MKFVKDKPVKPLGIDVDDIELMFSDGSYIETWHAADCSEYNYADWKSLEDTGFFDQEFDCIEIEGWQGGFSVNGYAVNCYSEQNGYYSTDLDVYYYDPETETKHKIQIDCELERRWF